MKKLLFSIIAIALIMTSCGPDAVKFNDSLVDYSDKAQTEVMNLQVVLETAFNSSDFTSVNKESQATLDSLNMYISAVDKMDTPSNGTEFKTSVNEYLKALIEVTNAYSAYSKLDENATEEDTNKINDVADKAEDQASKLFDILHIKQKEFASKNNMELK